MAIEGGYYNIKITKIKSSKNTSKNEQNTWQKYTEQNHTKKMTTLEGYSENWTIRRR